MTFEEFRKTLDQPEAPSAFPVLLHALWLDHKDRWDEAHRLAQEVPTADGSWVHAYLHRKEGDADNARYWYRRAGRPESRASLGEEWADIARHLTVR